MSFTRRFASFPPSQVIGQIEGVVIVDLPAPASIQGVSTGVVGVVGEFADMKYAVSVDGSGNVTSKLQPVEVTSAQDLLNKVGGWDETLGDFGGDDGNGYVTVYGKRFSRLILCPVNLASTKAVRLYRELPTNRSATNPTPIKVMQAATVAAGTEFKSGSDRVKLATAVTFTAFPAYITGTDGEQYAGTGPAHSFVADGADFVAAGVQVGDALVIGVIGGTGTPGTYRITSVVNATTLEVEELSGATSTWADGAALPWRIHQASTFDSSGDQAAAIADVQGYTLPARPLDATISANAVLSPTVAASAGTATAWAPLSGLKMRAGSGGIPHNAQTQTANATTTADIRALYSAGLDALLADSDPIREISIVVTSRTDDSIRSAVAAHVLAASANGKGRVACIAPPINQVDTTEILSSAYVGAERDERVIFCWPGAQQFVSPAVGFRIKKASGFYGMDGQLDVRADIFMASILSNLASERNPGQTTDPVPLCLSPILSFQSGDLANFSMTDYILFKQNGVCALRNDRTSGWQFQSGVTTALTSAQKNINRRRMADEIQDSLAAAYAQYIKQPLTNQLRDAIDSSTISYLSELKSANNPAAQRIEDFSVDSVSGNTPELTAQGVHVVIVKVRMLATAENIVLQAEVGQTVNITTA